MSNGMIFTVDGRYITEAQWEAEQQDLAAQARAAKVARLAAADANRAAKAASRDLYERRMQVWARHKLELAELKARHARELQDL